MCNFCCRGLDLLLWAFRIRTSAREPVPRQNRVTPFGDIVASPARGTLMGNRGCLHDASGRITRPWRLTAWIYCLLEFITLKVNLGGLGGCHSYIYPQYYI